MPDYGHELEFGFFLDPGGDPGDVLDAARVLEELAYDLIGIQDHPYQRRHLDALSLLAVILGETERVRVFPSVANLTLRPPAVLAKTAASLDLLSGGRFELGLGAGGFQEAARAMGGESRTPREALDALAEAVEVVRKMWSGERAVRFHGEHYRLDGVHPGPQPAHDVGVWLGVVGPRAAALTGRVADGWVVSMPYMPPAVAARRGAVIDRAAREAGREPSAVRRVYNLGGEFTATAPASATDDDTTVRGPAEHWVEVLTHLAVDLGFGTFVLWGDDPATQRTFITEVAPGVRERVAAHREGQPERRPVPGPDPQASPGLPR